MGCARQLKLEEIMIVIRRKVNVKQRGLNASNNLELPSIDEIVSYIGYTDSILKMKLAYLYRL